MHNPHYTRSKRNSLATASPNHLTANKAAVRRRSMLNHERRQTMLGSEVMYFEPEEHHHYSSMRRNTSVLAKQRLQEALKNQHGEKEIFSFSDTHHMTSAFSVMGNDDDDDIQVRRRG